MSQPNHTLSTEELICLDRCGSYPYYHLLRSHLERGSCPFCDLDRTRNEVLYEKDGFYVWEVPQSIKNPNKKLERHVLVVPMSHVRCLYTALDDVGWVNYGRACRWVFERFPILQELGGMEATRFGNMFYNAGTIMHAHSNFKVPVLNAAVDEPISKDIPNQDRNAATAKGFAERYEAGETP